MLRICGYYEFGFRDLQAPNGRRFKRQLSALINFMKYREDMGHLLETALDEVSQSERSELCLVKRVSFVVVLPVDRVPPSLLYNHCPTSYTFKLRLLVTTYSASTCSTPSKKWQKNI